MPHNWTLTYDFCSNSHMLTDGTRKAWFAVDDFIQDHIGFNPKPGVNGLAQMVAMGLRPYRTEGDFTGLGGVADTKLMFHAS
jgi:hypothetical protein